MDTNQLNQTIDQVFLQDVIEGLSKPQKTLPCKYFYDQHGSQLFDQICELDEYYLTRTEQAIMDRYADAMARQLGEAVCLLELGSGSSTKTHVLLEHLSQPAGYVPIDISEAHLLETAKDLRKKFPDIEILPVVADFTQPLSIPKTKQPPSHHAVYFPGSTIGNFTPAGAKGLLKNISDNLGPEGGLLIGIDLKKPRAILEAAYNDAEGVTSAFNLNLLTHINRELNANFVESQFEHRAVYDEDRGRVEMRLISLESQQIELGEQTFSLEPDEYILTEYSHKYTIEEFAALAKTVGFELHQQWTDDRNWFGVLHFVLSENANDAAKN